MFIYIRHGDNKRFIVNTNCPVIMLVQYLRAEHGILDSEVVDLCDDHGALKLLFQFQHPQEYANALLSARGSFIVCVVNRAHLEESVFTGNPENGAYVSITPLIDNPDPALLETLQSQVNTLEVKRVKQLLSQDQQPPEIHPLTQSTHPVRDQSQPQDVTPDDEPQRRPAIRKNKKGQRRTPRS